MINKEKEKDFDVIFAFAFGSPADLISNFNIAERVEKVRKCKYLGIEVKSFPVVTQIDIACSNSIIDTRDFFILDVDDRNKHGEFGYFSTLKLIKRFYNFNINEKRNWKKVLVIAAPMHAKRCVEDLRKMGFEAYEDKYLREKYSMSEIWWYNHNSIQFWTRSAFFWWHRKIFLILNLLNLLYFIRSFRNYIIISYARP